MAKKTTVAQVLPGMYQTVLVEAPVVTSTQYVPKDIQPFGHYCEGHDGPQERTWDTHRRMQQLSHDRVQYTR